MKLQLSEDPSKGRKTTIDSKPFQQKQTAFSPQKPTLKEIKVKSPQLESKLLKSVPLEESKTRQNQNHIIQLSP